MKKRKIDSKHLKRFKDNGYNPIHVVGQWYLVRHESKKYAKFSYYVPYRFYQKYN